MNKSYLLKSIRHYLRFAILVFYQILSSCIPEKTDDKKTSQISTNIQAPLPANHQLQQTQPSTRIYFHSNDDKTDEEEETRPDGTYPATVHYYNRNTGYSADYDLEVEVVDGEAETIYWPNGGYSEIGADPDKEYEVEIED